MHLEESDPDASLIEQMSRGRIDRSKWEDYVAQIKSWVSRRYPDLNSQADDLAHETAISAYVNVKAFRGESRFIQWTYGVARYVVCKHLRLAHRVPTVPLESLKAEPVVSDGIEEKLQLWSMRMAMNELSGLERSVFVCRTAYDSDHKDIAAALGITSNASRQTWMRAVRKVRKFGGDVEVDRKDLVGSA